MYVYIPPLMWHSHSQHMFNATFAVTQLQQLFYSARIKAIHLLLLWPVSIATEPFTQNWMLSHCVVISSLLESHVMFALSTKYIGVSLHDRMS